MVSLDREKAHQAITQGVLLGGSFFVVWLVLSEVFGPVQGTDPLLTAALCGTGAGLSRIAFAYSGAEPLIDR